MATPGLKRRLMSGTLWTMSSIGGAGAINLVVTAVLARVLAPADFGLLAAGLVLTTFPGLVLESTVGSVVVQHSLSRAGLSTVFARSKRNWAS